jgi:hypothetical protein
MHASQSFDIVAASFSGAPLTLVAPAGAPAQLPLRLNLYDAVAVAFAFVAAGPANPDRAALAVGLMLHM